MEFIQHPQKYKWNEKIKIENMMKDISSALCYLHSINIVHNDVHPRNLLLSYNKNSVVWKLTDMGLSKRLDENKSNYTFAGSNPTGEGGIYFNF